MDKYFDTFRVSRLFFQRSLAFIYFIAFASSLNQFPTLLGEKGFLPVAEFIRQVPFKQAPSLFYLGYSDTFFLVVAWLGILFSFVFVLGLLEKLPWWILTAAWLVMWSLYLSIVNVGQAFYGFGWESMLLEAGFFSAFLTSQRLATSFVPIFILRWMLFRVELGAGLIKLRGDECWRNLTCLEYHYETQPLPNSLSCLFHSFPEWIQRVSVLFSHFVQLVVPFGLFAPRRIAALSGALIIFHQMLLIVSGNYSWLNWLTIVLGLTALGDFTWRTLFLQTDTNNLTALFDKFLRGLSSRLRGNDRGSPYLLTEQGAARSASYSGLIYALAGLTILLSVQPTLNFFARNQMMNYNYNPFHLVGSYGAFGSVNKERYEIVIEGTSDLLLTSKTEWKEYQFKAKPGDIYQRPPQIAPYHLRLDWMMWFLPFSVSIGPEGKLVHSYELWFLKLIVRLLQADQHTLKLLKSSPFQNQSPRYIRALFYHYQYTDSQERNKTGAWWKRELMGEYLPPVTFNQMERFQ